MKIAKSLFIVPFLCCYLLYGCTPYDAETPTAVNGIIDLRTQTFTEKIPLNGQWTFYWQQLLNPSNSATAQKGLIVNFPLKWSGFILYGIILPSGGYATNIITLLLP